MTAMKPGFQTSEFWATLLTGLLPVFTLIFHRDFAPYVPAIATGLSIIAGMVYTLGRSMVKKAHATATVRVVAPPAPQI